jgi:hypothetical protein
LLRRPAGVAPDVPLACNITLATLDFGHLAAYGFGQLKEVGVGQDGSASLEGRVLLCLSHSASDGLPAKDAPFRESADELVARVEIGSDDTVTLRMHGVFWREPEFVIPLVELRAGMLMGVGRGPGGKMAAPYTVVLTPAGGAADSSGATSWPPEGTGVSTDPDVLAFLRAWIRRPDEAPLDAPLKNALSMLTVQPNHVVTYSSGELTRHVFGHDGSVWLEGRATMSLSYRELDGFPPTTAPFCEPPVEGLLLHIDLHKTRTVTLRVRPSPVDQELEVPLTDLRAGVMVGTGPGPGPEQRPAIYAVVLSDAAVMTASA